MSNGDDTFLEHRIEVFYDEFDPPNELLLHDPEGEGGYAWPVPSWATEDAVNALFPELSAGDRGQLIANLNARNTLWVRTSEWNDMNK